MYDISKPIAHNQARILKISPLTLETWPAGWVHSFSFIPNNENLKDKNGSHISILLKLQVLTGKIGIGILDENDCDFLTEVIVSETKDVRTIELIIKKAANPGKLIIRSAGHFQISVLQIFTISTTEKFLNIESPEPHVSQFKEEELSFSKTPKQPIIIAALPKSGSTFVSMALEKTLNLKPKYLLDENFTIRCRDFFEFITNFTTTFIRDHIEPSSYNLKIMKLFGINKVVLMLRDPRDALLSFAHHLLSDTVIGDKWTHLSFIAKGLITEDYYNRSFSEQIDILTDNYYSWVEQWSSSWLDIYKKNTDFSIFLMKYEDFCKNNVLAIQKILNFFNYDIPIGAIKIPEKRFFNANGICAETRFRKGIVGSYKLELSSAQISKINSIKNNELYKLAGWE